MNFTETSANKTVKSIDCIFLKKPHYFDLDSLSNDLQLGCMEDLEVGYNPFHIRQLQNYYPIYDYLFPEKVKENNCENLFLNHSNIFHSMNTIISLDEVRQNDIVENNYQEKKVFLKFAPLLDPIRYMIGKYDYIQNYISHEGETRNVNSILPLFSLSLDKKSTGTLIEETEQTETEQTKTEQTKTEEIENKINSPHNSCYVDGFFSYLSSHLYNEYKFINGIDFYGSHLGIQKLYKINVVDDIEYMESSKYFQKQINNLFFIEPKIIKKQNEHDSSHSSSLDSRNQKSRIKIDMNEKNVSLDNVLGDIMELIENDNVELKDIYLHVDKEDLNGDELIYENKVDVNSLDENTLDVNTLDVNTLDENTLDENTLDVNTLDELIEIKDTYNKMEENKFISLNMKDYDKSDDSCDSIDSDDTEEIEEIETNDKKPTYNGGTKLTKKHENNKEIHVNNQTEGHEDEEDEEDEEYDDEEDEEDDDEEDDDEEDDDEEDEKPVFAYIKNFPVQMICLEKCEGTLDELLLQEQLNEQESISAMFQIVITLAVYQKTFHFTHNDLHTNNIVYIRTKQPFLFYKFSSKIYKVPTYGYIFKIIDFGRSIYTINGKVLCSDSFSLKGDAETQYNCEPFYNPNKNRVEPNDSFDLCRLGCSIYDFLFDNDEKINPKKLTDFEKIIYEWCLDDKKQNILYKKNGDERYLHFKLYKMIARNVHNCVPSQQLEKVVFNQFLFNGNLKKTQKNLLINLDSIPVMV